MDIMTSREIFGFKIRLTDVILLGVYAIFALLAVVFPSRLENRPRVLAEMALVFVLYAAVNALAQKARRRFARFFLRTAAVQVMIFFVFRACIDLVHVFVSRWYDPEIVRFEAAVTGGQPTVWFQKITTPWLTEWMLFCYVFYVAVYPILSVILYFRHGEDTNEEYLFYVSLVVVLCMAGALALPVAGPSREVSGLSYGIPLRGHFFAGIGELIRTRVHQPGGAFPSIHCGAATIMWWSAWRFSRRTFYVLAPIVLSLYVSTVYGRFHYASDVFAGIGVAFLAMALGNLLIKTWNRDTVKTSGV